MKKSFFLIMLPIISKIGLSANPTAKVVENTDGIGGKLNLAKDGALYCGVTLEDRSNPMKYVLRHVNYRQQKNSVGEWVWKGATPKNFAAMQGSKIKGQVFTEQVEPYDVNGREVSSYTTIVLQGENKETVFRNAGHPITSQQIVEAPIAMPDASAFGE